jgi:ABC-2 type transport system ATP-binding protein
LRDVSLSVRRGELFGLVGPNGAGKTTLLKTLVTLTLPDSGSIRIDGIDPARQPEAARGRIGLCTSDDRSFYFRLTGRENLQFFGALVGLRGAALARRIEEVISQVDLRADLDRRFSHYSSGMRQRLAVARSLLPDPDILFFDEPTRAVDPIHAEHLRRFIRDELVLGRGKTAILATNLLEEAWSVCDRIAILRKGSIVALGPPAQLGAESMSQKVYQIVVDHASDSMLAFVRAVPGVIRLETKPQLHGVLMEMELTPATSSLSEIFRAVSANGVSVLSFRAKEPRPVDIFAELTRSDDADDAGAGDVE